MKSVLGNFKWIARLPISLPRRAPDRSNVRVSLINWGFLTFRRLATTRSRLGMVGVGLLAFLVVRVR